MADLKDYLNGLRDDQKLMRALDEAFDAAGVNYEKSIIKQLDQILTDMLVNSDGLVRPTMENQRVLERIDRDLIDILESEGLDRWQQDFNNIMQRRMETLDRLVKAGGLDGATGIDFQNLEAFEANIRRSLSKIGDASEFTAQQIRDQLLSYKLDINAGTGPKFSEIRDTLITKAGILPRYAGTVANTTLYSMTRSARIMQTQKAGLNQMKYVGVYDNLTRDFCRQHIGVVKSINDWDSTFNQVGPNPASEYGGGWNCRHDLIPWTDEFQVAYNESHPPKPPSRKPTPKPKPAKPNAPPPTPPPDPSKPPVVDNRAIEMSTAPLPKKFMNEMALLLRDVPDGKIPYNVKGDIGHSHRGSGAYYSPWDRSVNFVKDSDGKVNRRTMIHEYGHAAHFNNGIADLNFFPDNEFGKRFESLFDKLAKKMTAWKRADKQHFNKIFSEDLETGYVQTVLWDFEKAGATVWRKGEGQMGNLADTVAALTGGRNGWGHSKAYFKDKRYRLMELFAHGMENRYLGRNVLYDLRLEYSELYDDFMKDFNKLIDDLIESKKTNR